MAPGGSRRQGGTQGPHQPSCAGVQEEPELVGRGTGAGSPIGGEVGLARLDVVLGLAAGAVELVVARLAAATPEIGDDERPEGLSSDLQRRRGQETAEGKARGPFIRSPEETRSGDRGGKGQRAFHPISRGDAVSRPRRETGIAALRPGFDAGDDALDPAP
jgi:hypothetical protein